MGRWGQREPGGERKTRRFRESDPDSDPHIHSTVYTPSKQADYTESQYTGWEKDGGEDMRQGRVRADVNRGLHRERESSTKCVLKVSVFRRNRDDMGFLASNAKQLLLSLMSLI